MIRLRRVLHRSVWLGLFALWLLQVGPLISGALALEQADERLLLQVQAELHCEATLPANGHDNSVISLHDLSLCGYCELFAHQPLTLYSAFHLPTLFARPVWQALPEAIERIASRYDTALARAPPALI